MYLYLLNFASPPRFRAAVGDLLSSERFCRFPAEEYRLPSNDELSVALERRRFGGAERTWSATEFNRMIGKAVGEHRDDVADMDSIEKVPIINHIGQLPELFWWRLLDSNQ